MLLITLVLFFRLVVGAFPFSIFVLSSKNVNINFLIEQSNIGKTEVESHSQPQK